MPAKLKVYRARMGFYDSVVAARSQTAALAAWDVRQNLFAEGLADVTHDVDAVTAALAAPGQPLRRPAGSKSGFEVAPGPGVRTPTPRKAKVKSRAKPAAKSPEPPPAPPPDRSALDAAEKALADLESEHRAASEDIARARREIDARAEAAERDYEARRKTAGKALDRARRAYDGAAGQVRPH